MTKKCSGCQTEKPLSEFSRRKTAPDGLYYYCKACDKARKEAYRKVNPGRDAARSKAYRENNRAKVLGHKKAYYKVNRERIIARNKAWYEANKGQVIARMKTWHDANQEKISVRNKVYYEANRGRYKSHNITRKDRQAQRTPKWADMAAINAIYLEAQRLGMTVDHYYPLFGKAVSGLHVAENLQIISQSENDSKGAKHPEEFYYDANSIHRNALQ